MTIIEPSVANEAAVLMPKLAIYVSKKDMRELERWRHRINFSQVFMRALSREIRERSRTVNAPEGKVAAAARHYKLRLAEDSDALIDFGFRLGSEHVLNCRLSPSLIQRLLQIDDPDELPPEEMKTIAEAIGEDVKRVDEFSRQQGIDEEIHPTWRATVYGGYVKGVAAAWKDVSEQMRTV